MSTKIKLTYLINSLRTGGAEVGMVRLLRGLDMSLFDVDLVTLNAASGELRDKIPETVTIIDLSMENKWRLDKLQAAVPIFRDTDILICSLYHSTVVGTILGKICGISTILNWQHSTRFLNSFRRQTYAAISHVSSGLLADSESVESFLINSVGVEKSKVHLVPIAGINLDEYKPVTHNAKETVTVGTVGRLTKAKNPHAVVDTAREFSKHEVQFRIGGDGPLREELAEYAEGVENVDLVGHVQDVPAFLNECDLYFQPSRYEGLCITVIEGMACGLPVVASAVGGIRESVVDGKTGFTVDPDSINGYVDGIRRLVDNPEIRSSFGAAGRDRVENRYSQKVLVEQFNRAVSEYTRVAEDS